MLDRKNNIEKEMKLIKKQSCGLPEGKLVCVHNGKYRKWYQSDGHTSTYIPKRKREIVKKLAVKKYLSLKLKELESELTAINVYLEQREKESKAEELLEIPEYAELLSEYFEPQSDESKQWMRDAYEKNNNYPEQLIYKTSTGIMVRSKSEMMIAMLLHVHKIPFRYESALHLGEQTIYPSIQLITTFETKTHPLDMKTVEDIIKNYFL